MEDELSMLSPFESSIVISLATTSVVYLFLPSESSQSLVWSFPSTKILEPFFRYCSAISASLPKITTLCHSTCSFCSPVFLSFHLSDVATSERWKDKNTGEQKEQVEWHRVVIFGRLAEIAEQYLKKGSKIFVEGKLQTRDWEDSEGKKRYTTEVVAREMTMLDSKGDSMDSSSSTSSSSKPNNDKFEEDIPF